MKAGEPSSRLLSRLKKQVYDDDPEDYEPFHVMPDEELVHLPSWWDPPQLRTKHEEKQWDKLCRRVGTYFLWINHAEKDVKDALKEIEEEGGEYINQNCSTVYSSYGGGPAYFYFSRTF